MSLTTLHENKKTVEVSVRVVKDDDGVFYVLVCGHNGKLIHRYDEDDGVEDEASAIDLYIRLSVKYGVTPAQGQ